MAKIKRINLYPGLFPRRSNWADLQSALFTNVSDKWSQTKNYGVVSGLGIINVDLPNKLFDLGVGLAFDRAGDRIELDAVGAVLQWDLARSEALDNQFPPQKIYESSGAFKIDMQVNIGTGLPVDTYVFIQSLETIDLAATNRFRAGRVHQYPKIDFGYKVFTENITNAIALINSSQNAIFLGVIKVEGTNAVVLPAFTTPAPATHPTDVGFAYYQIPRLLGNDPRDVVGGSKHDHLGPYLKGFFYIGAATFTDTALRIRVLNDLDTNDYDDFFIGTGGSQQAGQNGLKWLTKSTYPAATVINPLTTYEFAVPVGRFQGGRIRVMLSSTGFFVFPSFNGNSSGTPDARTGLSPAQLADQHNVFWDNLRIEPDKDLSGGAETLFLPNHKFEYYTSKGVFGMGSLLSIGAVDCNIPGWTIVAGTNLPNRMVVVDTATFAPGFTGAGTNVLCTYSNAEADPGTSTFGKAGTKFGTGGNAQQYTVVDVPYTGLNREAQEQEDATVDFDNRHTANPSAIPGTVSQEGINASVGLAIASNIPDSLGSQTTRGWTSVTAFTRNKWNSLARHLQHIWGRLLEHDHSSLSGCQQVVTDGIADGAVTLVKLDPTILSGPGPGLVPVGFGIISFTGVCPSGWTDAGALYPALPGRYLLSASGTLPAASTANVATANGNFPINIPSGSHAHANPNRSTGAGVAVNGGHVVDDFRLGGSPTKKFTLMGYEGDQSVNGNPTTGFADVNGSGTVAPPAFVVRLCVKS